VIYRQKTHIRLMEKSRLFGVRYGAAFYREGRTAFGRDARGRSAIITRKVQSFQSTDLSLMLSFETPQPRKGPRLQSESVSRDYRLGVNFQLYVHVMALASAMLCSCFGEGTP
jgi:hypothetical protein